MNKHTQGPWEPQYSMRDYWFIEYQQGNEAYTLTTLECDEADARLIAAAPELLEALVHAEEALRAYSGGEASELERIRAAIQKATGEIA